MAARQAEADEGSSRFNRAHPEVTRALDALNWRCEPGLPVHIFCLSLSLFPYYFKWPVCVCVFFLSTRSFFDIHLDWGFIKKPQTME